MAKKQGEEFLGNTLPDADRQTLDPSVYNEIAKCARLLSIQLIESTFNIRPEFFEVGDEGDLKLEVFDLHSRFDEDDRIATSIFQFESSKKSGRKKLFCIRDKFAVFYKIPLDCDEFHAVGFARRVGVMACYPYFRAHVAQTSSLANAEMPILPTLAKMPVQAVGGKKGKKS